jgi:hypothetical protein
MNRACHRRSQRAIARLGRAATGNNALAHANPRRLARRVTCRRIVLGEGDVLLREGPARLLERSGFDVAEVLDTLHRVARGGSVVDLRWSASWRPPAASGPRTALLRPYCC